MQKRAAKSSAFRGFFFFGLLESVEVSLVILSGA